MSVFCRDKSVIVRYLSRGHDGLLDVKTRGLQKHVE
jgi:hypothetical protein